MISHLPSFEVIELRRYAIRKGELARFGDYFESYFPEAFQQLGALALGQGFERGNATRFTWLRGFPDMDARARINAAFYYGPLWKEHRDTMNGLMLDSDDVLLLTPLNGDGAVPVLPAVDVLTERAAERGVLVLQIFPLRKKALPTFTARARADFIAYRRPGIRQAGVLVTVDAANNFPQLPVREDGPYAVWLGIAEDDETLERELAPRAAKLARSLSGAGLLRRKPDLVLVDPTPRSRLRWLGVPPPGSAATRSPRT